MKATIALVIAASALISTGCDSQHKGQVRGGEPRLTYKPPYLPVSISVDTKGRVTVQGELSLATHFGTFSISQEYALAPDYGCTYVIIRDRRKGKDEVYKVFSGERELTFAVVGTTRIQVQDRRIVIDVTDGQERTVHFQGSAPPPAPAPTPVANTDQHSEDAQIHERLDRLLQRQDEALQK